MCLKTLYKRQRLRREANDPVATLRRRTYAWVHAHYPTATHLYARETIERVWCRWGQCSVMSGERDPQLLCIVPYCRTVAPPEENDLVVLTSAEAARLAKLPEREKRLLAFPPEVIRRIEYAI